MPDEDYWVATDLHALRMQSELLALENAYLRGRVFGLEEDLRAIWASVTAASEEFAELRGLVESQRPLPGSASKPPR
jgi:hypothetical protein